jgi:hypothetical protein
MTIQELRNQATENMAMCKKALAAGNLEMAETYLSYANKATLIMLGKEPLDEIKKTPAEVDCEWGSEPVVACWTCTKLHCMFNGES